MTSRASPRLIGVGLVFAFPHIISVLAFMRAELRARILGAEHLGTFLADAERLRIVGQRKAQYHLHRLQQGVEIPPQKPSMAPSILPAIGGDTSFEWTEIVYSWTHITRRR